MAAPGTGEGDNEIGMLPTISINTGIPYNAESLRLVFTCCQRQDGDGVLGEAVREQKTSFDLNGPSLHLRRTATNNDKRQPCPSLQLRA